jgi:hypothetical protein
MSTCDHRVTYPQFECRNACRNRPASHLWQISCIGRAIWFTPNLDFRLIFNSNNIWDTKWVKIFVSGKILNYSENNIAIDLINALPGNSSVNTIQYAAIEVAVFFVSAVTSCSGEWWSCDMCFLWYVSDPRLYKWQNSFGSGTSHFSVGYGHRKFVVEEEYKKSACEDWTCDLKTLCVM